MQFAYGRGGAASPLVQKHLATSPYLAANALSFSPTLARPFYRVYLAVLVQRAAAAAARRSDGLDPAARDHAAARELRTIERI